VLAVKEATRLKSVHADVKVVFRGAHPSGDPEECFRNSAAGSAIAGEGEIAPRVRPCKPTMAGRSRCCGLRKIIGRSASPNPARVIARVFSVFLEGFPIWIS